MTRSRQRALAGIIAIIIILSCTAPEPHTAAWTTGLDIVVALSTPSDETPGSLGEQLSRLLSLTTMNDRITVVTGPATSQQITLDDERTIDNQTLAKLLGEPVEEQDPATLLQLLSTADLHFARSSQPGLRPVLLFLDHREVESGETEAELSALLDQLLQRRCLIAAISAEPKSDLEQVLASYSGLTFVPESEAAEHRAMVELMAEARCSSRLAIVDSYLRVDESCQQLSLLLSGQAGSPLVMRPNGSLLDLDQSDLVWTEDGREATITIPSPEPGYWRILGEGWAGEAVLASPLRLGRMPLLPSYAVGETITLLSYLADGDRLSPDPYPYALSIQAELLGPSQISEQLTFYDDGQHGDGSARDGLYGTQLKPNIPGPYQLSYQLQRGLLLRQEIVSFKLVEPDGQERRYTLEPERIDLPKLVPGHTYQQTITLTSHLAKAESFRFQTGDDDTDLRSFGELEISPSEVELQPGESRTLTLAVKLQPRAAIGGYAGHLRLVPVSAAQRGQIVPLRLGVVSWPMAHWPWLTAGGVGLVAAMLTAGMVLSRPQLQGWLSNEALGGRERVRLHGYHFLPSPTSHRAHLVAVRSAGSIRVHLCVDRHDPPVLVNGLPAPERMPLNDGDQLRFGQVIWEFREDQDEAAATR